MAAHAGPGRGAHEINTSSNSQVSSLINKFNEKTMATNEATIDAEMADIETNTWADKLGANKMDHDYVVTVYFRKNSTVSNTTLSMSQKGRLAFKRLMIPVGKLISVDDSKRDCIKFNISGSVPSHTLILTQSFEAKPGLWTKPVAPVVKEKTIYIFWTSAETSNVLLEATLGKFGVLTSSIENQVYRARPNADEEEKMLDGVMSMDRQVKMKVRRNIPSIILVNNQKVNIRYEGQAKSCPRCLCRLHICPAKGNPRECEEIWKHKDDEDLPEEMRKLADRAKPRGDLTELMMNLDQLDPIVDSSSATGYSSVVYADHLDMCNIPEAVTKAELHEYLKKKDINIGIGQLMRDDVTKTKWRLTELLPQEVECIMMLVHGTKIGKDGRKIECFPTMTSTPPSNRSNQWFNPSASNSPDAAGSNSGIGARKKLDDDMKNLEEGEEVSPRTAAAEPNARSDNPNSLPNPNPNPNGTSQEPLDSSGEEVKMVDKDGNPLSDEVKFLGENLESSQIPKLSLRKSESGYEVNNDDIMNVFKDCVPAKTGVPRRRTNSVPTGRKNSTANTTLGVKPKEAPEKESREEKAKRKEEEKRLKREEEKKAKDEKARQKLEELIQQAKEEDDLAQQAAREKADKANTSKDEADMKAAEVADRVAADTRKKMINLQGKLEQLKKRAEELQRLQTGGESKRKPEDQSPGKEEGGEKEEATTSSKKKGQNAKKKTKAEQELENSLFK